MFWVGRIFFRFCSAGYFFFERTRPAASMRPLCLIHVSSSAGLRTGCHYFISMSVRPSVCLSLNVCLRIVIFTDCEICTRSISTNLVSMQAGAYGLTRGTGVFARRLEVVAVAGQLWIQWCVLGRTDFFVLSMSLHFQIQSWTQLQAEATAIVFGAF